MPKMSLSEKRKAEQERINKMLAEHQAEMEREFPSMLMRALKEVLSKDDCTGEFDVEFFSEKFVFTERHPENNNLRARFFVNEKFDKKSFEDLEDLLNMMDLKNKRMAAFKKFEAAKEEALSKLTDEERELLSV
jgi:hypothetical protein